MAYFLKKSKLKKSLYLQIYESFYNPQKGQTAHRSYKALGYENELKEKGIEDPIAYYKHEVDRLNSERKSRRSQEKQKLIGEESPEKYLGYFPLKSINEQLGVKKFIDLMQTDVVGIGSFESHVSCNVGADEKMDAARQKLGRCTL